MGFILQKNVGRQYKMVKIKFLRRNCKDYSRLGRKRKKLQKWRAPKGRDNKMRLREKGYPRTVEIGYKTDKKERHKIDGKSVVVVENIKQLEKIGKDVVIIIAKVGKKNRMGLMKKARELNLTVLNKRKPKYGEKKAEENLTEMKDEKKQEIKAPTSVASSKGKETKKKNDKKVAPEGVPSKEGKEKKK